MQRKTVFNKAQDKSSKKRGVAARMLWMHYLDARGDDTFKNDPNIG